MQLFKPTVTHFEDEGTMLVHLETYLHDKVLEYAGEFGMTRLAIGSGPVLFGLYNQINRNTFPIEDCEIYQTHENYPSYEVQKQIQKGWSENFLKQSQYLNLFPKNKEIAKNQSQYEEILDQLEDNLFDIVIVEINSNGEFAGLRKNSKGLTHLEQRLVLEENELSLTAESILDSKEIIAIMVDDNDETLTELLEGKKKAVDFPAKVLMAHPNLRIYYHSTF